MEDAVKLAQAAREYQAAFYMRGRKDDYGAAWNNSLRHQMREVPDFETVFGAVVEMVEEVREE